MRDRFDVEALRLTASLHTDAGQDGGIPRPVRFLAASTRLIRRRLFATASAPDPAELVVMLLMPKAGYPTTVVDLSVIPILNDGRRLTGRVLVVNEAATSGRYLEHSYPDDELFAHILTDLDLGALPAVIFDPRATGGELRYYEHGLNDLDSMHYWTLSDLSGATPDQVIDTIDQVHTALVSPQNQTDSVWLKPETFVPIKYSEAKIQSLVQVGLIVRFPSARVQHEVPVYTGRYDLSISTVDEALKTSKWHGVLELKVLKSRTSGDKAYSAKQNTDAVEKGYTQALSYRDQLPAEWGMLCCFDMRREDDPTDSCFDTVREEAEENSIHLKRWRLYHNSDTYRDATIA